MIADRARYYLMQGLAATPVVIDRLLGQATPADYDRRPDLQRFTIREVIAHLADWEPIWLERLRKMQSEEHPVLPSYDESQLAIDHDYTHSVVEEQRARFQEGRAKLLRFLRDLSPEDWERTGYHREWGTLTIATLAMLILGHDGYHLRQIAEWLNYSGEPFPA